MTSTIERSATVVDRLGQTAQQDIFTDVEFDHLVGSVIEIEPRATLRDVAMMHIYDAFKIIAEKTKEDTTALMTRDLKRALAAAPKYDVEFADFVLEETAPTTNFRITVFSKSKAGGEIVVRTNQDGISGDELIATIGAYHASVETRLSNERHNTAAKPSDYLSQHEAKSLARKLSTVREIDDEVFGRYRGEVSN
ncbi:MAG: hypothetical protein WD992_02840 [Candidatus Levyibacteriota bacterium]